MLTFILLTVAGAVLAAMIGSLWYSPLTPMGRLHMQYVGFAALSLEDQKARINDAKPRMPKLYGAQLFLSLLTSAFVVGVVMVSVQNGVPLLTAIVFPLLSWLCFVVPTVGSSILWGTCDPALAWKKFLSDILYSFATILLIALVTSVFAEPTVFISN